MSAGESTAETAARTLRLAGLAARAEAVALELRS